MNDLFVYYYLKNDKKSYKTSIIGAGGVEPPEFGVSWVKLPGCQWFFEAKVGWATTYEVVGVNGITHQFITGLYPSLLEAQENGRMIAQQTNEGVRKIPFICQVNELLFSESGN